MGLVEDQVTTVGRNENDEVGNKAAVANFANNRESSPILSNPNHNTNYIFLPILHVLHHF